MLKQQEEQQQVRGDGEAKHGDKYDMRLHDAAAQACREDLEYTYRVVSTQHTRKTALNMKDKQGYRPVDHAFYERRFNNLYFLLSTMLRVDDTFTLTPSLVKALTDSVIAALQTLDALLLDSKEYQQFTRLHTLRQDVEDAFERLDIAAQKGEEGQSLLRRLSEDDMAAYPDLLYRHEQLVGLDKIIGLIQYHLKQQCSDEQMRRVVKYAYPTEERRLLIFKQASEMMDLFNIPEIVSSTFETPVETLVKTPRYRKLFLPTQQGGTEASYDIFEVRFSHAGMYGQGAVTTYHFTTALHDLAAKGDLDGVKRCYDSLCSQHKPEVVLMLQDSLGHFPIAMAFANWQKTPKAGARNYHEEVIEFLYQEMFRLGIHTQIEETLSRYSMPQHLIVNAKCERHRKYFDTKALREKIQRSLAAAAEQKEGPLAKPDLERATSSEIVQTVHSLMAAIEAGEQDKAHYAQLISTNGGDSLCVRSTVRELNLRIRTSKSALEEQARQSPPPIQEQAAQQAKAIKNVSFIQTTTPEHLAEACSHVAMQFSACHSTLESVGGRMVVSLVPISGLRQ